MRIQVRSAVTTADGQTIVEFTCGIGAGAALWRGKSPPTVGREYHIEFTVNQQIIFDRTAVLSALHEYAIGHRDTQTVFTGVVDGVDDDGMAYFRLSPDCLIMVESIGDKIKAGAWLTLTLPVTSLELYDYKP